MLARAALTVLALAASPVAGAPVLEQPIDCVLGETCYVQNYVDADPSSGWSDFACGRLSYDGHKGTDFALPTTAAMQDGVDVLAAAAGRVVGTRDGMQDALVTKDRLAAVKGKECGNGVAIDHGAGWVTQYCHMKRGSISVVKGEIVDAGTPLGQVGLSGKTEFPHLHMSLRHKGKVVDPFAPGDPDATCASLREDALWATNPGYVPGGIVRLGYDIGVPDYADIKSGVAGTDTLPPDAPAIVLFSLGFGSRTGDQLEITITGPNGFSFTNQVTLKKPQALYFRAAGKKRPAAGWPTGNYLGTVTLTRNGQVYARDKLTLTIRE
ncbi:M23 family metallopeptidase [Shimia sediminis]|uniref:M23 family metallopeptidase n=1 Tax=Shimia sediminis TaxID=2497945 RepID=UPI000F8F3B9E|nr:M23 family metallopeptidase [Shimia sediminis]